MSGVRQFSTIMGSRYRDGGVVPTRPENKEESELPKKYWRGRQKQANTHLTPRHIKKDGSNWYIVPWRHQRLTTDLI